MFNYIKWFLGMAALIVLTIIAFVPFANAEDYKCFAELYPKETAEARIVGLGDTITINGIQYRVMAEAKHPGQESWIQWIDAGDIDDVCDFAMFFAILEDGNVGAEFHFCDKAFELIGNYCLENQVDIDDVLHLAEPLNKPKIKA